MRVEYRGVVDRAYPERLAERLRELIRDPGRLAAGANNARIARERFHYDVLAAQVAAVIERIHETSARGGQTRARA
jgi:hypothetical protein